MLVLGLNWFSDPILRDIILVFHFLQWTSFKLPSHTHRHAYELGEARAQLEQFKELLVTYEQSIGRKDHVIANLTAALQKQVSVFSQLEI